MGCRKVQHDRTAERMTDRQHGAVGFALHEVRERGHVGIDRPRRRICRPSVADQVGSSDREVGEVLRRQGSPALSVSSQAVYGQDSERSGRSIAMDM